MAPTKTINYRLSLFFHLSFIGDKQGSINDKSIFFIFGLIFAKFEPFLMIFKVPKNIQLFHFENCPKILRKSRKYMTRIFPVKILKNFSAILRILQCRIFIVFLSFIAINGLEFLVFRDKSKNDKNGSHNRHDACAQNVYDKNQILFELK